MVDEAGEGTLYVLTCLRTRFKCMDILLLAHIKELLFRDLPFINQIAFISNDYDWDVTDLAQLLDPLTYTNERASIC